MVTSHVHLMLRLRISRTVPLFYLFLFLHLLCIWIKTIPCSAIQMFNTPSAKTFIEYYPLQFHLPVSVFMSFSYSLSAKWGFPTKLLQIFLMSTTWRIFSAHHNLLDFTILLLWASMTFTLTFCCEYANAVTCPMPYLWRTRYVRDNSCSDWMEI